MTNIFAQLALLGTLVLAAWPLSAQTIYKCVDAAGGVLISNNRVDKNCKSIVSAPENSLPAPKAAPKATATPTPASFPRVQEDAQKARDNDRRHGADPALPAGTLRSLAQGESLGAQHEPAVFGKKQRAPWRPQSLLTNKRDR